MIASDTVHHVGGVPVLNPSGIIFSQTCTQALDPKKYYIVTLALFANGEVRDILIFDLSPL